jgi:transposase
MEELLVAFPLPLYRNRNAIERMFCRLKDFRRIATRYGRSATNFLAAVCIAATISDWLWSGP